MSTNEIEAVPRDVFEAELFTYLNEHALARALEILDDFKRTQMLDVHVNMIGDARDGLHDVLSMFRRIRDRREQ
jgi:hypothetical protein